VLKIRLRRMGSNHRPFYRLVVSDSRKTPRGRFVDSVGYFDPTRNPPALQVDTDRMDHWISKGARPSETVASLLRRARTERS
jgi:small subunit ribosomal protein S16